MTWRIEIFCTTLGKWRPVRPSSATVRKIQTKPYEFKTEGDAREMARVCYDSDASMVRVVNTCDHPHGFPYAGKVPCTGPRLCPTCGARHD